MGKWGDGEMGRFVLMVVVKSLYTFLPLASCLLPLASCLLPLASCLSLRHQLTTFSLGYFMAIAKHLL
ncbi:hypothetical protein [Moorena producens]|uniref:hypothetical protein n=1 Tax=Moorena producens TaxID=1155739 RepID=UPI0011EA6A72|nr:hypothetical protein [Moorena producens]